MSAGREGFPREEEPFGVMRELVLASASLRRKELLRALGLPFRVIPADVDESVAVSQGAEQAVQRLAERKAAAVRRQCSGQDNDVVVLGADTLIALDGHTIGKPPDARHAGLFLRRLRGKTHRVVTGIALVGDGIHLAGIVTTEVTMRDYSDREVAASIRRGTPFDKAGAYAIQDAEFAPVDTYSGCYCNVMGLPLWDVLRLLVQAGLRVVRHEPDQICPRCAACPRRASVRETRA